MKLNKNEYTVEAATGGGFFAYYRDNLLCSAYGETPDEAYENLIMVLSPDTQERADVLTIKSVVYSLAPSIATAVLPLVASLVTEDGSITDMNVYRVLYPPFAVIGIICSVNIYANTQEKIVQEANANK